MMMIIILRAAILLCFCAGLGSVLVACTKPVLLENVVVAPNDKKGTVANNNEQGPKKSLTKDILRPPDDAFALADKKIGEKIDYETLNGSSFGVGEPAAERDVETTASLPDPLATAIRAVMVSSVNGAPGGGNDELRSAMQEILRKAGWPVVSKPQPDALIIAGEVKLTAPANNQQQVTLQWRVKSPDGKILGTIGQSNYVPQGSLNKKWGESARLASQAAASGIFELIARYR